MKKTTQLTILLILLSSCSLESSTTKKKELLSEPSHQLENIFKVSELNPQHFISYISDIEFLSNGHIIIHNGRNSKQLLELNRSGELQNIIGRSGRGPGEFVTIDRFVVTPDDTLHVFDGDNKKHQLFAKNEMGAWELSRVMQLELDMEKKFILDFPLAVYESTESSYLVKYQNRPSFSDTTSRIYHALAEADYNLKPLEAVHIIKRAKDDPIYRDGRQVWTASFSNVMKGFYFYDSSSNEVIYIKNNSNEIFTLNLNGEEQITGYLPYEHLDISERNTKTLQNLSRSYESEKLEIVRSKFLEHAPYYENIYLDNDQLWIKFARADSTAPTWAMTSTSGDIESVFDVPENFRALEVNQKVLYGIQEIEGIPYFSAYSIKDQNI